MPITRVGLAVYTLVHRLGAVVHFLGESLLHIPKLRHVVEQLSVIGLGSLPIVMMAALFTGFIATYQVHYLAGDMIGLEMLGMMVMKIVFSELGPTLIGLVLAGRMGAKVAAEIGTMRVTEQVDAMIALSLHPLRYIVTPRIYAALLMSPILFIYGSVIAIVSAQFLATALFDLLPGVFYNSMRAKFLSAELVMGLTKSTVFGVITVVVSCYYGYTTTEGAFGVGRSTRKAVVVSTIGILIANLIISKGMMS